MRSPIIPLLAALMVAVPLGAGACATTSHGSPAEYHLLIRQNDRVLAEFGLPQLQKLPQVEIVTPQSQGNPVQKGPTVSSVLDAAGAVNVAGIRVEGRDPAQTLTASELTDQVVLSVTKRNTLKLAGANLGRERWVRDVTDLVVNP